MFSFQDAEADGQEEGRQGRHTIGISHFIVSRKKDFILF